MKKVTAYLAAAGLALALGGVVPVASASAPNSSGQNSISQSGPKPQCDNKGNCRGHQKSGGKGKSQRPGGGKGHGKPGGGRN